MYIKISKWDKYPFILSAVILPATTIFVTIHESTKSTIFDDSFLALIGFLLTVCTIGFAFWCKWEEDKLQRKAEKLEKTMSMLDPKSNEYESAKKELQNTREEIMKKDKDIVDKIREGLQEKRDNLRKDDYEKRAKISNELIELEKEGEIVPKTSNSQFLIFATLYAVVGAIAITQAITVFSDPQHNEYINSVYNWKGFLGLSLSNQAFVIASFFTVAVLFIHCGIVFFSTDASKLIGVGNKVGVFISSVLLFLEAVVLFYAANSIDNILNFSLWIFMLMVIDIAWVLVNIAKKIEVLFQWLHLDSSMLFFLLMILMIYGMKDATVLPKEIYEYVLVIFLIRTVADYKMGWRSVWGKFDVSDKSL